MILTTEQIDYEISEVCGTWVKRRNLRNKLIKQSNQEVNKRIEKLKKEIRALKSEGVKEQHLSHVYAKVTELELKLI